MGASGWEYWIDYNEDMEQALEQLKLKTFESNNYVAPYTKKQLLEGIDQYIETVMRTTSPEDLARMYNSDPDGFLKQMEKQKEEIRKSEDPKNAESIEELLEQLSESGTHSILDIYGVSSEPAPGCIYPAPEAELVELFGTSMPTHKMVYSRKDDFYFHNINRWEGKYFTIFKDGKPDEIYIFGCSGD